MPNRAAPSGHCQHRNPRHLRGCNLWAGSDEPWAAPGRRTDETIPAPFRAEFHNLPDRPHRLKTFAKTANDFPEPRGPTPQKLRHEMTSNRTLVAPAVGLI